MTYLPVVYAAAIGFEADKDDQKRPFGLILAVAMRPAALGCSLIA